MRKKIGARWHDARGNDGPAQHTWAPKPSTSHSPPWTTGCWAVHGSLVDRTRSPRAVQESFYVIWRSRLHVIMIGWLELNWSMIKHDQRLFCVTERLWCEPIMIKWPKIVLRLIGTLYFYCNSIFEILEPIELWLTSYLLHWRAGEVLKMYKGFKRDFREILWGF